MFSWDSRTRIAVLARCALTCSAAEACAWACSWALAAACCPAKDDTALAIPIEIGSHIIVI
uniref:Uncharacterized protein n=1 Tax=uncultured marine virus TaxID=186617 RepID=A0A0F7L798_9VIRU|nr:hypothetical protein [uncultured marine virus]